jgi:hypothetical protein
LHPGGVPGAGPHETALHLIRQRSHFTWHCLASSGAGGGVRAPTALRWAGRLVLSLGEHGRLRIVRTLNMPPCCMSGALASANRASTGSLVRRLSAELPHVWIKGPWARSHSRPTTGPLGSCLPEQSRVGPTQGR